MPSIYLTENLHNKSNNINPWRYVGSDQHDRPEYLGSSKKLKQDIDTLGKDQFIKTVLQKFDNLSNRELRKIEAEYLQSIGAKADRTYYNLTQTYSPGCGVKGMKHQISKKKSAVWRASRAGWVPTEQTRRLWSQQRKGRTQSLDFKQLRSQQTAGENNPNALVWDITFPDGLVLTQIRGLRGYCRNNNLPFEQIYNCRNGWKAVKYGTGRGGQRKKNDHI